MFPKIETPDQALELLLNTFPMQDRGSPAMAVAGYAIAIEGIDAQAVVSAAKRFVRGDVEGHDGRFMPTPPQLAKEARLQEQMAQYRAIAAQRQAKALPKPETEFSVEHRQKMLGRFREISARLGATH